MIDVQLLGRFSVRRDGAEIPPSAFGGRLARALVRILVTRRGEFVSRDVLTEALWPKQAPGDPAANLSVIVNRARRALGDPLLIVTGPGGYSFVSDDRCQVDAESFLAGVEAGRRQLADDPEPALRAFEGALGLWRGEPLAEDAYQDWAQEYRDRLLRAHLEALETGSAAALLVGDAARAVTLAERAVAREPLREAAHLLLVRALAVSGDTAGALAALGQLRQRFVEELGLDLSPEAAELETRILRGELHGSSSSARPFPGFTGVAPASSRPKAEERRHDLLACVRPSCTSFIGREQELTRVGHLLETRRLVTLVGPPGVGKSRIALEVALRRRSLFPDGAWLVELQPVTDARLVAQTIATVLALKEMPQRSLVELLAERLRDAELLLLLEDCGHLLEGVRDVVERLLAACGQLRIMATSGEPLVVEGETIHRVGGLGVPGAASTRASAVDGADSARLFVERAGVVQPGFRLTDANAAAVAAVCRRVDGIPLAIEVAAARVGMLPADHIAAALEDRLHAVAPARGAFHDRRLQAVVEWSYGLLGEPERRLFSRLAVFVGGFTMEAAEAVCAEPGQRDLERLLSYLLEHSLVSEGPPGHELRRYRLPETHRAFALDRLCDRSEARKLRAKHAAFFLALAERGADALWGPDQGSWLRRLEAERANLRAALGWGLEQGEPELAVRLAGSLARFWDIQGHYSEGRGWLDRVLGAQDRVSPSIRVQALLGAAILAASQGDLRQGTAACEQVVVLCRDDDLVGSARSAAESWTPDEAERKAAWEMYVELVTRIGVQGLRPEEGLLREALSSLYTLFDTTRQILHRYGPAVAGRSQGTLSFGAIAVTMLNRALRPLLTSWHAELTQYESQRPPDVSPVDHERRWPRAQALRQALAELQPMLVRYANLLSNVAGVAPLTG